MTSLMKFKTDILVIGGGFAGIWAARKAREYVKDVLIVDKGPLDWGGLGGLSGGDMVAVFEDEDPDDFLKDFVFYYDGLCNQTAMRRMLRSSLARFRDYESMGHTFKKKSDGTYANIPQRGLPHVHLTVSAPYGKGGVNLRNELFASIEGLGIRRLGNVMMTHLIKDGERVSGAVGFFNRSGEGIAVEAKAVLLCTNSGGWKTSYHQNSVASGCVELALDAGAVLRNMEFLAHWNVPRLFAWEGQTALLPLGGRFLNSDGQDFMKERYSPVLGAKTDTHYNCHGMALEFLAGRGPLTFDVSQIPADIVRELRPRAGWMKLNDEKLQAVGIDFFKDTQVWIPQAMFSLGGLVVDENNMTSVPGLFAAGTAECSAGAGVYCGGLSMCHCATAGFDAGISAGKYVSGTDTPSFDDSLARAYAEKDCAALGKSGIAPKDVVRTLQEIVVPLDVSILKAAAGLTGALEKTRELMDGIIPVMGAEDPHYLGKLTEARGMGLLTECYLAASLARKESRAGHFRADFPQRDNKHDVYWVDISRRNGRLKVERTRLPMEEYPIVPTEYYMDQFTF